MTHTTCRSSLPGKERRGLDVSWLREGNHGLPITEFADDIANTVSERIEALAITEQYWLAEADNHATGARQESTVR